MLLEGTTKTLKKEALEKYVGLDEAKIGEFFEKSFIHQNQAGGGKRCRRRKSLVSFRMLSRRL